MSHDDKNQRELLAELAVAEEHVGLLYRLIQAGTVETPVQRIARRHQMRIAQKMIRTAGEVRFIKDHQGDKNEWGWGTPGPMEREISPEYEFNPAKLKPIAQVLRATLAALGHATSAHAQFVKVKSATVSPDGSLGGQGYIQKVSEMRRQLMNTIEALSSVSDTFYDEINAPHWNPAIQEQSPREREQVQDIMEDVEEIKEDPEEWAQEEEESISPDNNGRVKRD